MFTHWYRGGATLRGAVATLIVGLAVSAGSMAPLSRVEAHAVSNSISSAPCIPAVHSADTIASISFGRTGGNIRPFSVNIYGDGFIAYKGAASPPAGYAVSPVAVLGLQTLATAEGFATWPKVITSPRLFPDSASLFVSIR